MLAGEGEEGVAVVFDGARGGAAFDFEIGEEVEDERIRGWGLDLWSVGGNTLGRGFPGWHRGRWQRAKEEQWGKMDRQGVDLRGQRGVGDDIRRSMKKRFSIVSWAMLVLVGWMMTSISSSGADGAYRHVVFFKFKDDASKEAVKGIEEAFIELSKKVDTVTGFEWGTNVSPEGLNDGFTHCFLVTFKDKAGLEVYLPHPEHEKFVSQLKPLLDKACVLDYVAQ